MTDAPQAILHIGMPKCGSSALQTALSHTPELTSREGQRYRYTASRGGRWKPHARLAGYDVTRAAMASPFGYASWLTLQSEQNHVSTMDEIASVMAAGRKEGYIPICSNEGWISFPEVFEEALKAQGHPHIKVIAFVRPVIDWVNAAFWQWGVWNTPTIDRWMERAPRIYGFGLDLEAWHQIPNVDLQILPQRGDVVQALGAQLDVDLQSQLRRNVTVSPALLGFQFRNRSFRPSATASQFEFVVQRWCPPIDGTKKLWALRPKHLVGLRETMAQNVAALERIMPVDSFSALMEDQGWTREAPYHQKLSDGPSDLNDPAEALALLSSIIEGVGAAGGVGGRLELPPKDADLERIDRHLEASARALVEADRRWRRRESKRPFLR